MTTALAHHQTAAAAFVRASAGHPLRKRLSRGRGLSRAALSPRMAMVGHIRQICAVYCASFVAASVFLA